MTFISVGVGVYMSFCDLDVGLLAIYASTLATNIIATTLIAAKAWSVCRSNQVLLLELT